MTCTHQPLLVAALAALALAWAGAAPAQAGTATMQTLDCKAVAAIPNFPMSFEQCEQQKALVTNMQQGTTGGERPGDDQMTCEQILAELSQVPVPATMRDSAAQSVAAGQTLKNTYDAAMAEASAAAPAQAATAMAGVAVAVVPGGAAAATAVIQAQMAQQAAIAEKHKPLIDSALNRANAANAGTATGAMAMMQGNPRMARLAHLVSAKNCKVSR